MTDQDILFNANALLAALHYQGVEGFSELIDNDMENFGDPGVVLSAIIILKNHVDNVISLAGLPEDTYSNILKASAEDIAAYNDQV